MVLKPGREAEAEKIFRKWELDFAVIGEGDRYRPHAAGVERGDGVQHSARAAGR